MSNPLANWWRSRQFSAALKKGNIHLAQELLKETHKAKAKLSLLERVFRDKLQSEQSSAQYEREVLVLRKQISQASQTIDELSREQHQFEQSLANVRNQLRQKEQEVVSIKQQLEAHEKENDSIQHQLVARGRDIEVLHDRLSQRDQEIVSIQQQLAVGGREIDLSQQHQTACEQEIQSLRNQLNQASQSLADNLLLSLNQNFIESVEQRFKLNKIQENLLQYTGINEEIFYELEENLVEYLKLEFERYTPKENLKQNLKQTHHKDIYTLRKGQDPQYNSYLSPHIYFMSYFLEGVYSAYLAWFLVYKSGLLRSKVNILDIGAGSGAMIFGLFSLLKSASALTPFPQNHISYCSLDQQSLLQHHGFEFWKHYIEPQPISKINTYCRFNTIDLFTYGSNSYEGRELPKEFFDFIVISHCIFANEDQRVKSHKIYKKIFSDSLKANSYVLIVVQGRRLFQAYGQKQTENQYQEESLIKKFINELGLKLEWYKYITSTGKRLPMERVEFARFASKNLPMQTYMSPLLRQYLEQRYDSHYALDDYIIIAKKG